MRAYGLDFRDIVLVADSLDLNANCESRPKYVLFTLKVKGDRFRKISASGRKTNAVCLHGHTIFMNQLLMTYPQSYFTSSRYGRRKITHENILDHFEELKSRPIEGSMHNPIAFGDLCRCGKD